VRSRLGVGGAVGGLIGALVGHGNSGYEAKRYEGRSKKAASCYLLTATRPRKYTAKDILSRPELKICVLGEGSADYPAATTRASRL